MWTCTQHPNACIFFFNDTATTEIYTLSLHDALPICERADGGVEDAVDPVAPAQSEQLRQPVVAGDVGQDPPVQRSEEHTSELQSRQYLVCRLLLEKKKKKHHPVELPHRPHSLLWVLH